MPGLVSLLLTKEALAALGIIATVLAIYFKGRTDGKSAESARRRSAEDQLRDNLRKAEEANRQTADQAQARKEEISTAPDTSKLIELWNKYGWGPKDD